MWGHYDPEHHECDFFFKHTFRTTKSSSFLCVYIDNVEKITKPYATEMKGSIFFNQGKNIIY